MQKIRWILLGLVLLLGGSAIASSIIPQWFGSFTAMVGGRFVDENQTPGNCAVWITPSPAATGAQLGASPCPTPFGAPLPSPSPFPTDSAVLPTSAPGVLVGTYTLAVPTNAPIAEVHASANIAGGEAQGFNYLCVFASPAPSADTTVATTTDCGSAPSGYGLVAGGHSYNAGTGYTLLLTVDGVATFTPGTETLVTYAKSSGTGNTSAELASGFLWVELWP